MISQSLDCDHNQLVKIWSLPRCKYFYGNDNRLSKLPFLPLCQQIEIDANPDLYYPSQGHHQYFQEKWRITYHYGRPKHYRSLPENTDYFLAMGHFQLLQKLN